MSANDLLQRLRADLPGGELDFTGIRQQILTEHENAITVGDRVLCLAMFKTVMDTLERNLEQQGKGAAAEFANFKEARRKDYHSLIVQEALVGKDICVETLNAITLREIAAGRMTPDNNLRKIAMDGMAAPHLTRTELVAAEAVTQSRPASPKTQSVSGWRRAVGWIRRE